MKLTHGTYETSVRNPECRPEEYNPATPLHNSPDWMLAIEDRESYERACDLCGVKPMREAAIQDQAYALRHQEFRTEQWVVLSREQRVSFKLAQRRLASLEIDNTLTDEQRAEALDRAQRVTEEAEALEAQDGDGYGL